VPARIARKLTNNPRAIAPIQQNGRREDIAVVSGEGAIDLSQKAALAWVCKRTTALTHL
jgi:hypothetical protein